MGEKWGRKGREGDVGEKCGSKGREREISDGIVGEEGREGGGSGAEVWEKKKGGREEEGGEKCWSRGRK